MGSNRVTKKLPKENHAICQGRLTLESGVPISLSDQSTAGTLYFTPYKGNLISTSSGNNWSVKTFSELSLSLSGYTASKPYDIWIYNNAGTLTLDSTIWTDDDNRAAPLDTQDEILVESGDATRRYLGTIYINSSGAQCEDTITQRFVWNYYNRVIKGLYRSDGTEHTYDSATWRAWNNSTTHKLELVIGINEDHYKLGLQAETKAVADTKEPFVGVGIDSTTESNTLAFLVRTAQKVGGGFYANARYLTAGYHYFAAVEREFTNVASTFYLFRLWASGYC